MKITREELQELIKERERYSYIPFTDTTDSLLEKKVNDNELRNFWYIGRDDEVDHFYKKNPNTEWKISGIYQFDYFYDVMCVPERDHSYHYSDHYGERYFLFHFSKNNFKKVEIGFDYSMQNKRYNFYLDKINFWEMHGIEEKSVPQYIKEREKSNSFVAFPVFVGGADVSLESLDITTIPQSNFFNKYIRLIYRYDKSVVEFYGLPTEKEKCKPLNELVCDVDPLAIMSGDIYISGQYFNKQDGFNSFIQIIDDTVDINDISDFLYSSYIEDAEIIRCRDEKIRKYLYVYLFEKNTFVEKLFKLNYLDEYDFEKIPVFIPSEDLKEFDSFYDDLIVARKKQYFDANKKYKLIDKKTKFKSTEQLMDKYMDEFEKCINSEAYTAALIMAGSVLEAYLIDWLSEEGDIESDNLEKCINNLQDKYGFKEPPWDAGKAHFIRKRRNLVHPKKLLNTNEDISKNMCDEAYIYLKYIIDYRNKYGKK